MSEQLEQINTDAQEVVSSEPQSPSVEQAPEQAPAEQPAASQPDNTPFHEHPRFKELVEQKNSALEQSRQLNEQYRALEERLNDIQNPKKAISDPMYDHLKSINPEFAEYMRETREQALSAQTLREELQQLKQEQFVNSAVGEIKNLHATNKVAPELQSLYEQQLDAAYRSGQIRGLEDVRKTYKSVHEAYSKVLDSVKRSERESYVKEKTKDSSSPTAPAKGKPVKAGKDFEFSKDPAEARQQAIKRVLELSRASNDV